MGGVAVAFFFILSGFLLNARYGQKFITNSVSYPSFLLKRFNRIYYTHVIFLIAFTLIWWSPEQFYTSLFLIQAWYTTSSIWFGYNSPAWFLSALLFCYLIFPLIAKPFNRLSFKHATFLMGGVLVLFSGLTAFFPSDDSGMQFYVFYIFPPVRFIDFLIGAYIYRVYMRIKNKRRIGNRWLILSAELLILSLIILSALDIPGLTPKIQLTAKFWIPIIILVLYSTCTDRHPGPLFKILQHPVLLFLGAISFECYMAHIPVFNFLYRIQSKIGREFTSSEFIPLALAITLACGYAVNIAFTFITKYPLLKRRK